MLPLRLANIGTKGLNRLLQRDKLSPEDLYAAQNVRAVDGHLVTSPGLVEMASSPTVSGTPLLMVRWATGGVYYTNIMSTTKGYSLDANLTLTSITPVAGDFTGAKTNIWDALPFMGKFIVTNGVDSVHTWSPPSTNKFTVLAGSPPKAKCIATLLGYVLLGNVNETNGGYRIKWSDLGDPTNWSTGDSGYINLYQNAGDILRMLPLNESIIVYRDDSIHNLYYVGPPFIFAQSAIFSNHGLIAPRAVVNLGDFHVYWGTDDVYMFDGQQKRKIGTKVIKEMQKSYDAQYRGQIAAWYDSDQREILFGIPTVGSTGDLKRAWIYSLDYDAWRLDDVSIQAATMYITESSATWNSITGIWTDYAVSWQTFGQTAGSPLFTAVGANGKLHTLTITGSNDSGTTRERVAETGLFNPGEILFQDPEMRCTMESLEFDHAEKGAYNVEISIGTQDILNGDAGITWTAYTHACSGETRHILSRLTARYFALKFRSNVSDAKFDIAGVTCRFKPRSRRTE